MAALERYPDGAHMPTKLVYELILNLAESGEFEKAAALFHNRFFSREEGGTNVRQVWLEVQVQRAISLAQSGRCTDAVKVVDNFAAPVADLPFTHDGLEPFLRSARLNYLTGTVYKSCDLPEKSRSSFQAAGGHSNLDHAVWSWRAAQQLPGYDQVSAKNKLEDLIERAKSEGDSSSRSGRWFYNVGMLDQALGNSQQAEKEFRDALLSPDQLLSYHFARLAMSDRAPLSGKNLKVRD